MRKDEFDSKSIDNSYKIRYILIGLKQEEKAFNHGQSTYVP